MDNRFSREALEQAYVKKNIARSPEAQQDALSSSLERLRIRNGMRPRSFDDHEQVEPKELSSSQFDTSPYVKPKELPRKPYTSLIRADKMNLHGEGFEYDNITLSDLSDSVSVYCSPDGSPASILKAIGQIERAITILNQNEKKPGDKELDRYKHLALIARLHIKDIPKEHREKYRFEIGPTKERELSFEEVSRDLYQIKEDYTKIAEAVVGIKRAEGLLRFDEEPNTNPTERRDSIAKTKYWIDKILYKSMESSQEQQQEYVRKFEEAYQNLLAKQLAVTSAKSDIESIKKDGKALEKAGKKPGDKETKRIMGWIAKAYLQMGTMGIFDEVQLQKDWAASGITEENPSFDKTVQELSSIGARHKKIKEIVDDIQLAREFCAASSNQEPNSFYTSLQSTTEEPNKQIDAFFAKDAEELDNQQESWKKLMKAHTDLHVKLETIKHVNHAIENINRRIKNLTEAGKKLGDKEREIIDGRIAAAQWHMGMISREDFEQANWNEQLSFEKVVSKLSSASKGYEQICKIVTDIQLAKQLYQKPYEQKVNIVSVSHDISTQEKDKEQTPISDYQSDNEPTGEQKEKMLEYIKQRVEAWKQEVEANLSLQSENTETDQKFLKAYEEQLRLLHSSIERTDAAVMTALTKSAESSVDERKKLSKELNEAYKELCQTMEQAKQTSEFT